MPTTTPRSHLTGQPVQWRGTGVQPDGRNHTPAVCAVVTAYRPNGPGTVARGSITARVRSLIGTDFQRQLPTLQDVADRLHMTTPTLHRRLSDEGTSLQQLKDDCRRDAAVGYIENGDYTTQQLAELMGFSDSSTFHRAFKKWTGMTPLEYRRQGD